MTATAMKLQDLRRSFSIDHIPPARYSGQCTCSCHSRGSSVRIWNRPPFFPSKLYLIMYYLVFVMSDRKQDTHSDPDICFRKLIFQTHQPCSKAKIIMGGNDVYEGHLIIRFLNAQDLFLLFLHQFAHSEPSYKSFRLVPKACIKLAICTRFDTFWRHSSV